MSDKKDPVLLINIPENLKKDANFSSVSKRTFGDFGNFQEQRDKIRRTIENRDKNNLKVDYSNFANHVFFDSAESKLDIAKKRVLDKYPFSGSTADKEEYHISGSGYERHILKSWPNYVGYIELNGTDQYITASDNSNKLLEGTSSFYVSAIIKPVVTDENIIIQSVSGSVSAGTRFGYDFYISGADDPQLSFTIYSGSSLTTVSSAYVDYTASFNNVAALYDRSASKVYLYVSSSLLTSSDVTINPLEHNKVTFCIGSGSKYDPTVSNFDFYSGSVDEVRVLHTASVLWHKTFWSRNINADEHVVLNYKFNESVTGENKYDTIVVDYSKNGINGGIVGYTSSARVSGSNVLSQEKGEPILYSIHSDVVSFTSSLETSASLYDAENNNYILRLIPENILIQDAEASSLYTYFALSMGRFFDEIKSYIDQFDNLRITNYQDKDETPDLFLPYLKKYFGIKAVESFSDADPLSFFYGEGGVIATGSLGTSMLEIRNQFWRRIANNFPYIVKSKGKRHGIEAFLNVLGINKNYFPLKEYGQVTDSSIQNTRLQRQRPVHTLSIGTGDTSLSASITGSYVRYPNLITAAMSDFTIECTTQLPYVSASYSGSLLTEGSLWQFVDTEQVTGSFSLVWNVVDANAFTGKFILTGSDGQFFSSSNLAVFDGDIVYIASGINGDSKPFIRISTLEGSALDLTSSETGVTAFSGVFTGSDYDFIIGANSGSVYHQYGAQGLFSEVRYWSRVLSGSEMETHGYDFQSIGIEDLKESPHPLVAQWMLEENKVAAADGTISSIVDMSQNGKTATGHGFTAGVNPYTRKEIQYNYLSPSVDLSWTEDKIRTFDKSRLTREESGIDYNTVSLEFNLVDGLNRDMMRYFSNLDVFNEAIGNSINKYRDDYEELEAYRKIYFAKLSDNIDFTRFFKLFKWFDRKINTAIKQLLPAKANFIGGEQVVESHFLERPKYNYKYPVFRTPKDIPEGSAESVLLQSEYDKNDKWASLATSIYDLSGAINVSNADNKMSSISDFDSWTKLRTTVSSSVAIDPIGNSEADILVEGNDLNKSFSINKNSDTLTSGNTYRCSVFAKAINRSWIRLFFADGADYIYANFDLSNIALGSSAQANGFTLKDKGIVDVGGGWRYCWIEGEISSTAVVNFNIRILASDSEILFDGQSQNSVQLYQAHVSDVSVVASNIGELYDLPLSDNTHITPVKRLYSFDGSVETYKEIKQISDSKDTKVFNDNYKSSDLPIEPRKLSELGEITGQYIEHTVYTFMDDELGEFNTQNIPAVFTKLQTENNSVGKERFRANTNSGVNYRRQFARRNTQDLDARNIESYRPMSPDQYMSGTAIVNKKYGNPVKSIIVDGTSDSEHYFSDHKKVVKMKSTAISGTLYDPSIRNENSGTFSASLNSGFPVSFALLKDQNNASYQDLLYREWIHTGSLSSDLDQQFFKVLSVYSDNNGTLFMALESDDNNNMAVLSSSDDGASWGTILNTPYPESPFQIFTNIIKKDSSEKIYVAGNDLNNHFFILSSSDGGENFGRVLSLEDDSTVSPSYYGVTDLFIDSSDNVFVSAVSGSSIPGVEDFHYGTVYKSTTGKSGSFNIIDAFHSGSINTSNKEGITIATSVIVDNDDNIYSSYACFNNQLVNEGGFSVIRKSTTGTSGSFSDVYVFHNTAPSGSIVVRGVFDPVTNNKFYLVKRYGKLYYNNSLWYSKNIEVYKLDSSDSMSLVDSVACSTPSSFDDRIIGPMVISGSEIAYVNTDTYNNLKVRHCKNIHSDDMKFSYIFTYGGDAGWGISSPHNYIFDTNACIYYDNKGRLNTIINRGSSPYLFLNKNIKYVNKNMLKTDESDIVVALNPRISMNIKRDDGGVFNENDITSIGFTNSNSNYWLNPKEIRGTYYDTPTNNEKQFFYNFYDTITDANKKLYISPFPSTMFFYIDSTVAYKYIVNSVSLEFDSFLTEEGVSYFNKIDNQHNKKLFSYIKLVDENNDAGTFYKNWKEFPHSMGIYQMPKYLIGDTSSGKIGTDEDNIVQVNYIGSYVQVMWPAQDTVDATNIGLGDASSAQKIGTLNTTFVAGKTINVEEYDHCSLYCYGLKRATGTSDFIEIQVERRPIKSVPFAVENMVEYGTSGSFATAELKDLIYKKEVNYADLTIPEVSYVIDLPLTNVKELRIKARHANGQADQDNANFIVWGRFIRTDEET